MEINIERYPEFLMWVDDINHEGVNARQKITIHKQSGILNTKEERLFKINDEPFLVLSLPSKLSRSYIVKIKHLPISEKAQRFLLELFNSNNVLLTKHKEFQNILTYSLNDNFKADLFKLYDRSIDKMEYKLIEKDFETIEEYLNDWELLSILSSRTHLSISILNDNSIYVVNKNIYFKQKIFQDILSDEDLCWIFTNKHNYIFKSQFVKYIISELTIQV